MTNKEKALACMALVMDRDRTDAEREAALTELQAIKKAAKTSYEKLGVSEAMVARELEALAARKAMQVDLNADPLEETKGFDTVEELMADLNDDEDEGLEPANEMPDDPPEQPKAKPVQKQASADERGRITAAVKTLLTNTDMPYADIVAAVKAEFPKANTTARSVASVASEMRGAGLEVASRRKPAK